MGYVGPAEALPLLLDGLHRESYRGYDSSGVVVFGHEPVSVKAVGHLEELEKKLRGAKVSGKIGLGHNRWATHGTVTEENAHPQTDCRERIFVVHNGIIENYAELKEMLLAEGHRFTSETDTEVVAHLIERFFQGKLEDAVRRALRIVRGAYGLAVVAWDEPQKIVAARLSSPLVIAVNDDSGHIASDPAALVAHTTKVIYLDDNEIAVIEPGHYEVTNLQNAARLKTAEKLDCDIEETTKGEYPYFTLQEIHEQPASLENTLRGRLAPAEGNVFLGGLSAVANRLSNIDCLHIIACGTTSYAGMVGAYMLEEHAGIPTAVDIASEFRYRRPHVNAHTAYLYISQSGETADTLWSLREVKRRGGLTIGIVNVVGSSIARESHAGVYNHAGPEISVMSTKAFTSQLAVLAMLTVLMGRQREMSHAVGEEIVRELWLMPDRVRTTLRVADQVAALAEKYRGVPHMLLIGRKYSYPIALEGAMKLKEAAYVHGQGFGAGELKHGSLALVDEHVPTIAICPSDSVYEKTRSNIQEVRARRGPLLAIATEGNKNIADLADDVVYVPNTLEMLTPLLTVIPLQLLAYYSGVLRGVDVDRPRNLAKSVTVE